MWYLNGNMQGNPHKPKEDEISSESTNEPHEYACDCQECQIKFGNLPLLVQVIEGQQKVSSPDDASTSKSVTSTETNITSLAEPSTSSTLPDNKKIFSCPHCHKQLLHRGDFNKHVRKHTGEQPYTCDICNRKFSHTSNLKRHLKVHSGDKPFICGVCNKSFSRKDKLNIHKKNKLCKKFNKN